MILRGANCRRSRTRALTLIETLVYMSVVMVLIGIGTVALFRAMDNSLALRRNAGDITDALHAGENWRSDVRAAGRRVQLETNATEQILRLSGVHGDVSYRFATNAVFRRLGRNDWTPVLGNVKASAFVADRRENVNAWRWELELQTRTKNISRVRPLFTFIAVSPGAASR
jgi:type II secretory pathway pseudopilin PulG